MQVPRLYQSRRGRFGFGGRRSDSSGMSRQWVAWYGEDAVMAGIRLRQTNGGFGVCGHVPGVCGQVEGSS
jgi:hypothetical protein